MKIKKPMKMPNKVFLKVNGLWQLKIEALLLKRFRSELSEAILWKKNSQKNERLAFFNLPLLLHEEKKMISLISSVARLENKAAIQAIIVW